MEPQNEKEMRQNMKAVTRIPLNYRKKYLLNKSVETNKNEILRF